MHNNGLIEPFFNGFIIIVLLCIIGVDYIALNTNQGSV